MLDDAEDIADPGEEFVGQLTACQGKLYGYIMSLLPDPHQAKDVLQETNLVIWRKASEFERGTEFGAWVSRIAFYQVMAHRSRQKRDRHVYSDETVALLAHEADLKDATDARSEALHDCVEQLSPSHRDLLWQRYTLGSSVAEIAQRLGKKTGALRVALFRVRQSLLECIERKLPAEAES